ncbi:MAG: Flp pilus assembly protein CpaB [Planctomycetota bacterium]|nr:Flp pilus assembly protein CpaB [Planctomycetota bacterium]
MSTRLALILAIVLGVVAAVAVKSWLELKKQETLRKIDPVLVLSAKENLKKGEPLRENAIGISKVPKTAFLPDMIPESEMLVHVNKILTRDVDANGLILRSYLQTRADKPTAAAVVREGKRAVTLQVDQVTGVAGLIQPGYYVDLIGTFDLRRESDAAAGRSPAGSAALAASGSSREVRTICLLEAVKVLAVDNRTMESGSRSTGNIYRTITVEVDPWNAMRLINAAAQGRIHCLLRAPEDKEESLDKADAKRLSWDLLSEVKETVDYMKYPRELQQQKKER